MIAVTASELAFITGTADSSPNKTMYDFTSSINRARTGSIKIDMAPEPVKGSGLVPLTIADQEFAVAPEITDAVCKAAAHGIYGYTYADSEYRSAVNSWMLRRHNWNISKHNLFTVNGVVTALGIAVRALTTEGEGIVIQPPVYPPFAGTVRKNNRILVENPLILRSNTYEIDFDDLDSKTRPQNVKMLILCSPHNPVGRVWTKQELLRLGEICKRNNIIVLADEIHNDLIHNGAEHTVFASLGDFADFTVTCTAVSKTFNLAGLACSNILISNDTIADRFKAAAERENTSCVPYFARAATIAAYTKAEQWLDELNGVIESNFNLLYSFLRTELPMLNAIRAEGTYLAWIDMRSLGLSDSALEELMLKNYLALDEGYIFGTGGSGFERWNLALPQNELKAALERLKAAVLSLQSKQ